MKPVLLSLLRCALLPLAWGLAAADAAPAASGIAQASATVVQPVTVSDWLGAPVSVQDLLLAQQSPAGPMLGALVPRVATAAATPTPTRVPLAWIAEVLEARTAFSVDMVPGAGLLPAGPAATITAAANGDGETPLVITVAFN